MKVIDIARVALIGGSASLLTVGLITPALADTNAKRDEDAVTVQLVVDDDDDARDPRGLRVRSASQGADDMTDYTSENTNAGASAVTNDNTASNFTAVSRDQDLSRGDVTRDWTRDGGDLTRDLTANSTNDSTRNDTR